MLPTLEIPALSDGNVSGAKHFVAALAIIFQPGALVRDECILSKLAFFDSRGDPLKKRTLNRSPLHIFWSVTKDGRKRRVENLPLITRWFEPSRTGKQWPL